MKWNPYSDHDVAKTYATNLKKFRKEVHMTQAEVADKLQITTPAYRAYENIMHPKFPRPDTLMKICNLFEKNIHEFFYISGLPKYEDEVYELTVREKNDIEDAVKNYLRPGDSVDFDIKYIGGKVVALHRALGPMTVSTEDLHQCLQVARNHYSGSLSNEIYERVERMERDRIFKKEGALFDEMLAKQCGMDYDGMMHDYKDLYRELMAMTPPGKSLWELPFVTFREILFYAYFVRINPLEVISKEILKLVRWGPQRVSPEENVELRHSLKSKLGERCDMTLKELERDRANWGCIDIQISPVMNDAYLSSIGKSREEIQKDLDNIGSQPFDDLRFYLYLRDLYRQRWLHPTDTSLHGRIFNNHFLENDAMIENGETPKIW